MTIDVTLLTKSKHPLPDAPDCVSVKARYPRFIHSEVMTHRVFSRNASSSRAIPVMRLIRDVLADPAVPVEWGSNRPGMQAGDPLVGWRLRLVQFCWFAAMYCAVVMAYVAAKAGAHKQVVNRILEPWSHITVIITATEWQNFFDLRCHPAADPTMRALAEAIRREVLSVMSTPLRQGEWHAPFAAHGVTTENRLTRSVASCARVSFLNHDGTQPDLKADQKLVSKLAEMMHLSPFEHQAYPNYAGDGTSNLGPWWNQYRKDIE